MIGPIAHVGITVRDLEGALTFYQDVLGMMKLGEATFSGEEASRLTGLPGTTLRAAYLRSSEAVKGPPLELLHFVEPVNHRAKPYSQLNNIGITEVAFWVDDIEDTCTKLSAKGVRFLSPPQLFEFSGYKAKAVYFSDPDGIMLELIQIVRQ